MKNANAIGLIECGVAEKSFAQTSAALPTGFSLKKVFAFHESSRKAVQHRFSGFEWASDCEAIFEDESIDLVLISAPAGRHRELIGAALKAKKHVQVV